MASYKVCPHCGQTQQSFTNTCRGCGASWQLEFDQTKFKKGIIITTVAAGIMFFGSLKYNDFGPSLLTFIVVGAIGLYFSVKHSKTWVSYK